MLRIGSLIEIPGYTHIWLWIGSPIHVAVCCIVKHPLTCIADLRLGGLLTSSGTGRKYYANFCCVIKGSGSSLTLLYAKSTCTCPVRSQYCIALAVLWLCEVFPVFSLSFSRIHLTTTKSTLCPFMKTFSTPFQQGSHGRDYFQQQGIRDSVTERDAYQLGHIL